MRVRTEPSDVVAIPQKHRRCSRSSGLLLRDLKPANRCDLSEIEVTVQDGIGGGVLDLTDRASGPDEVQFDMINVLHQPHHTVTVVADQIRSRQFFRNNCRFFRRRAGRLQNLPTDIE